MSDIHTISSALLSANTPIKILLADDSEIVRRGIRQLLAAQDEIEIVGEAADFAQTIRMTTELNPQVVVLDLHMPDEYKISPQEVKAHLHHRLKVLGISIWNDDHSRELAERLGVSVLLDKMDLANTLIPTIMQLERARHAAA